MLFDFDELLMLFVDILHLNAGKIPDLPLGQEVIGVDLELDVDLLSELIFDGSLVVSDAVIDNGPDDINIVLKTSDVDLLLKKNDQTLKKKLATPKEAKRLLNKSLYQIIGFSLSQRRANKNRL